MVELLLPKQIARVRFPSPAPLPLSLTNVSLHRHFATCVRSCECPRPHISRGVARRAGVGGQAPALREGLRSRPSLFVRYDSLGRWPVIDEGLFECPRFTFVRCG